MKTNVLTAMLLIAVTLGSAGAQAESTTPATANAEQAIVCEDVFAGPICEFVKCTAFNCTAPVAMSQSNSADAALYCEDIFAEAICKFVECTAFNCTPLMAQQRMAQSEIVCEDLLAEAICQFVQCTAFACDPINDPCGRFPLGTHDTCILIVCITTQRMCPETAAAPDSSEEAAVQDDHCGVEVSWECVKAWGDLVFNGGLPQYACGVITAGPCPDQDAPLDYVCYAVTGRSCGVDN